MRNSNSVISCLPNATDGNARLTGNLNPLFCSSANIQKDKFPYLYDIRSDCDTSATRNGNQPPDVKGNKPQPDVVICDCCLQCY